MFKKFIKYNFGRNLKNNKKSDDFSETLKIKNMDEHINLMREQLENTKIGMKIDGYIEKEMAKGKKSEDIVFEFLYNKKKDDITKQTKLNINQDIQNDFNKEMENLAKDNQMVQAMQELQNLLKENNFTEMENQFKNLNQKDKDNKDKILVKKNINKNKIK